MFYLRPNLKTLLFPSDFPTKIICAFPNQPPNSIGKVFFFFCVGYSGHGVMLIIHFRLAPKLIMQGSLPLLPYTPS